MKTTIIVPVCYCPCRLQTPGTLIVFVMIWHIIIVAGLEMRPKDPVSCDEEDNANGRRVQMFVLFA